MAFFAFLILTLFDLFVIKNLLHKTEKNLVYNKINTDNISVVMPAYNEEKAIKRVVTDYLKQQGVKEVVVLDNGSADNTGKIARECGARVVRIEKNRGFGGGAYLALKEARGDIIVFVEADYTQRAGDIKKLLPYLENVDMTIGTRTTEEFLGPNTQMDWFLKYGNIFIAKLLQIRFFNRYRFTDISGTPRAIKKEALKRLLPHLTDLRPTLMLHMIIEAAKLNMKIVEIPVSYNSRIGESKYAGKGKWKAFKLGLGNIALILKS